MWPATRVPTQARLGEASTKWGPIALHFQRTVKAVKRKFDKLQALQDRGGAFGSLNVWLGPAAGADPAACCHCAARATRALQLPACSRRLLTGVRCCVLCMLCS